MTRALQLRPRLRPKSQDVDKLQQEDSPVQTEQELAVVPSRYIGLMLGSVLRKSSRDEPIRDLSPFRAGNLRLSFSDTLEDAPHAVPLMDRVDFLSRTKELLHSG